VHVFFYWDGARGTTNTPSESPRWEDLEDRGRHEGQRDPRTSKGVAHTFPPEDARYVRVNVLKNSVNQALHLVEVKVYAPGTAPGPPPPPQGRHAEGFHPARRWTRSSPGGPGPRRANDFENGILVCDETARRHDPHGEGICDFVIRFDFKLSPGGTTAWPSGPRWVSTPPMGGWKSRSSTTGREARQAPAVSVHGSIYGVVPAKREFQNPVGDWNSEEVTAKGPHITIVSQTGPRSWTPTSRPSRSPMDGKEHPA